MDSKEVDSIFYLAGIEILNKWELVNQYWPKSYVERIQNSPWWLVKTELGLIRIGWRKRVMSIDWSDTEIRKIVTEHDVTKSEEGVHASSSLMAVEYLIALKENQNEK